MQFPISSKVVGWHVENRRNYINKYVCYASKFKLIREPLNEYDENAIGVHLLVRNGSHLLQIGYIPREKAAEIAPIMDAGTNLEGRFKYKITTDDGKFRGLLIKIVEKA